MDGSVLLTTAAVVFALRGRAADESGLLGFAIVAAVILALFLYFLPSVIAFRRRHRERVPIFVLNLLAGWTFVAWMGALIWSLTSNVEPSPIE